MELSIEDWVLRLDNRVARLKRLIELAPVPKVIVSNEIDLILQALEGIEKQRGDRDGAARMRKLTDIHLAREIEEAGGQEAWEAKVDAEMAAEDALIEAEGQPRH